MLSSNFFPKVALRVNIKIPSNAVFVRTVSEFEIQTECSILSRTSPLAVSVPSSRPKAIPSAFIGRTNEHYLGTFVAEISALPHEM
jgi:hypothetical protein